MLQIKFPDGNTKNFEKNISILEVAKSISNSLAKEAVAGRVNGQLKDLCVQIEQDCELEIIKKSDPDGIDIVRHSFAHLTGHAIKQMYPDAKMAIGPVIKNGFYYDIELSENLSDLSLKKIEKQIDKLIKQNYDVVREVVSPEKAIEVFQQRNENYKVEIVNEIPKDEIIALYHHQEYIDMCRGPHVPNTKFLRHFKLTKISGAYWRGDSKNKMLQRIYGTAWDTKEDLANYLTKIEEAEKKRSQKTWKTA